VAPSGLSFLGGAVPATRCTAASNTLPGALFSPYPHCLTSVPRFGKFSASIGAGESAAATPLVKAVSSTWVNA